MRSLPREMGSDTRGERAALEQCECQCGKSAVLHSAQHETKVVVRQQVPHVGDFLLVSL